MCETGGKTGFCGSCLGTKGSPNVALGTFGFILLMGSPVLVPKPEIACPQLIPGGGQERMRGLSLSPHSWAGCECSDQARGGALARPVGALWPGLWVGQQLLCGPGWQSSESVQGTGWGLVILCDLEAWQGSGALDCTVYSRSALAWAGLGVGR